MLSGEQEIGEERKRRVCKVGCGIEQNYNKQDTQGFPEVEKTVISRDARGFRKIQLRRSKWDKRTLQSSTFLSQCWRGNTDIQLILYEGDPKNIDPHELARITDYIVAYTCKGNENFLEERLTYKDIVLSAESVYGDGRDVTRIARKLLNATLGEKMISKQENAVLLSGLNLVSCSESVAHISISGVKKISAKRRTTKKSPPICQYANRVNPGIDRRSFHQFVLDDLKTKGISGKKKSTISLVMGEVQSKQLIQ